MLSRNQEKHIRTLHQGKYRERYGQFIAEGSTLVLDLLASGMQGDTILASEDWFARNPFLLSLQLQRFVVSGEQMRHLTTLATPSEVLGVFKIPQEKQLVPGDPPGLMLYLDGIRDPGNMGTILRIADWFGIELVLLSPDCVDAYNPKVVHSSMGSIARVEMHIADVETLLKMRSHRALVGTTLAGNDIYQAELPSDAVLIIGNESHGIRSEVLQALDIQVRIPDYPNNRSSRAESLNAAVATAIVCAEFRRRNRG